MTKFAPSHFSAPTRWIGRDGESLSAELSQPLNDSLIRLHEQCQHWLEEAAQTGVSVDFAKIVMTDMIQTMERLNSNFSKYHN